MIGQDEIAEATRAASARMEELGLPGWMEAYDIDQEGVVHVATQCAVRAAMMSEGRDTRAVQLRNVSLVRLGPNAERLVPLLAATWLDGFTVGLTVKGPR